MNSMYTQKIGLTKTLAQWGFSIVLVFIYGHASATTYQMPVNPGDTVLEQFPNGDASIKITQDETLLDVALRYTLGQTEIVKLNPKIDRWLIKKDEVVRLPNRRVLPNTPHNGITLNISEFRMYYYPPNNRGVVMSFAHGIGRQDWRTPLGKTSVIRKIKDPSWNPPESIRKEHAAMGDPLPAVVPPGPHNPLGTRALYLNLPGEYRIHGTDVDKIFGIGMQITHGCVRMYPTDVEELYDVVPVGTPVYIVKQPIKVGWLNNALYVEAHPDLEGEDMGQTQRYAVALDLIRKATKEEMPEIDQKALNQALKDLDGEPVAVYERVGTSPFPQSTAAVAPTPTATNSGAIPPTPSPTSPTTAQTQAPSVPPAPVDNLQPNTMTTPAPVAPTPAPSSGQGSPGGYYKPVFR
jgi:L,D-transpeptidase ErfK/SrfK